MDIKLTRENNITTGKVYKVCFFVDAYEQQFEFEFLMFDVDIL